MIPLRTAKLASLLTIVCDVDDVSFLVESPGHRFGEMPFILNDKHTDILACGGDGGNFEMRGLTWHGTCPTWRDFKIYLWQS